MEDKQPRWIERLSVFRNAIVRLAEVIAITMWIVTGRCCIEGIDDVPNPA